MPSPKGDKEEFWFYLKYIKSLIDNLPDKFGK